MLMVLVVFSIIIGAQVSDGLKDSFGAFATICVVIIGFFMLLLGEKSWYLLYLLPVMLHNSCFVPDAYMRTQSQYPLEMGVCAALPLYWSVMSLMGYVRFKWRPLLGLDILMGIVFLFFVASYIRYPVSVNAIDEDAEFVGGKEYIWCALAVIYYASLSFMSGKGSDVMKVIKMSFYALFGAQLFYALILLASGKLTASISSAYGGDTRFPILLVIAPAILYYAVSSLPLIRLVTSAKKMLMSLVGAALVLMIGSREMFVGVSLAITVALFVKRELAAFCVIGGMVYSLLFALSAVNAFTYMPTAFQRAIVVLPGMHVSDTIERSTRGSSETRKEIWKIALDSRTGYIRDYVWGDGFQTSTADMRRYETASMRRGSRKVDMKDLYVRLARTGSWHNGWISTVHRIGTVGLVVVNVVFLYGFYLFLVVGRSYLHRKEFPYIMTLCLPYVAVTLTYPWGTQTLIDFFASFSIIAVMKILYCIAQEQGFLCPLFRRERYVPMLIRSMEEGVPASE